MSAYTWWFIASFVLLIVELMTGTFYVLMISLALAAGGLVALAGGGFALQMVIASLVGTGATLLLRRSRFGKIEKSRDASTDPMQSLDIGQSAQVKDWENGQTRVMHRGSAWDAVMAAGEEPATGSLTIVEVRGTRLTLSAQKNTQ
jgi:membrane protein implicated in regulation of membrane protease activity